MVYDPFGKSEKSEDLASDNRARSLLSYLATRKEPQDEHSKTVVAFISQKAASDHRIRTLEQELMQYRESNMNHHGYHDERHQVPRVLPIPADARSVEVKF